MALRSLKSIISVDDQASAEIAGIDAGIDGISDSLQGVESDFSDLEYQTGEFAYSARSDIQDVESGVDELGHKAGGFRDTMSSVADSVRNNWQYIAGGAAAAGAAIEGVIRMNQELELQTEQVAVAMGEQTGEVREMIGGMTDYTFSTEDALSGAQRLIQSGYDQQEQMEELLPLFDSLSDATGLDMVQAIDMAFYALHGLGGGLDDVGDHIDTFTWLQTQTRAEMNDLERIILQMGPELTEMGVGVDDLAVLLGAMGEEAMLGRGMMTRLNEAMNEAEGDSQAFMEGIGLSSELLEEQRSSLAGAEGLTEQLADAYADNFTWLQKMHSQLMETNYAYGGLIANLDFLSPVLMGAATLMGTAAAGSYLLGTATGVATVGFLTMGVTVAGVTAPLWLLIGAIAAVGAGIYLLWDNWDQVIGWLQDTDLYQTGKDVIMGLVDGILGAVDWVKDAVSNVGEAITGTITGIFGISSPSTLMMEYGVNLGEGLTLGMEEESEDFFTHARRMFTPNRERLQAAGGLSIGDIHVYSNSSDPQGVAQEVKRTLRSEFSREAEKYFSRQRRRR